MLLIKKILELLLKLFVLVVINIFVFVQLIRLGVFPRVQVLLVTSSMTTMTHQYIARIFASEKDIKDIMEANNVEYVSENSQREVISFLEQGTVQETEIVSEEVYLNPRKKRKLPVKDTVELVNISKSGYKGHMLIVSNPKRIKLGVTNKLGKTGTKLNTLIKDNRGIGGINAGGFADEGGVGNGGTPTGLVVENGEIRFSDKRTSIYSIIGFDKDGILVLGNYTIKQIMDMKIMHGVSFYPFLVVNGKPTTIHGDGGWGINPRTAIGQREDGTVLMLVINGRQVSSVGATIKELQRIMIEYGAVNAANLDGGSSTVMYYKDKLINKPCSPYGERPLPTAFIIEESKENIK